MSRDEDDKLWDHLEEVEQALTALQDAVFGGTDQEVHDLARELSRQARSLAIATDKEGVE